MSIFKSDSQLVEHFSNAIDKTKALNSNLNNSTLLAAGILNYHGMSGVMTRILMNNLANFDGLKYAEIGTFTGSTLFSALYGNKIAALCCDNWSQFNGPSEQFKINMNVYSQGTPVNQSVEVFEADFNDLEFGIGSWKDIDFYLFDGPHDKKSQYNGIVKAYPALSDRFIVMVDDWNWGGPREGTLDAIRDLEITVLNDLRITTDPEQFNEIGQVTNRFQNSNWHNGIAVFACKKKEIA